MDDPYEKLILALETALDGGSAAILLNGRRIDHAAGADSLSKSEDILPIIENLLKKNGIEKREIGLIAVSDGPGSLTGLRIGLAIAKGLGDALAAKVCKISLLEALTYQTNFEGRVISALYSKRSGIFFREFLIKDGRRSVSGDIVHIPKSSDFKDTLDKLRGENISFVFEGNLTLHLADFFDKDINLDKARFCSVEGNLAELIGLAAAANASDNESEPQ
jgi:tRNA threonylcarbamoyladenosine biosynthesis protein TsaB